MPWGDEAPLDPMNEILIQLYHQVFCLDPKKPYNISFSHKEENWTINQRDPKETLKT